MARYNYLKYNVAIQRKIENWGSPTEVEESVTGYTSYWINADDTFDYPGSYINLVTRPLGNEVYKGKDFPTDPNTLNKYVSKAYSDIEDYMVIADKYTVTSSDVVTKEVRGSYISTVVAENGTYPNDGIHTDGYWYVRSSEINEPPSKPSLLSPNGGEIITTAYPIKWSGSWDANGDVVAYQLELTTNNGKSWTRIADNVKGTQYTFDFINQPDTSTAKIRIRAFDGALYSEWEESDAVFTINFNYPPNPPYNLSPSNGEIVDKNKTVRFVWTHSDPNGSDPQSKFDLRWRLVGDTEWQTITETTTRQYQDLPANTLLLGQIEWQVKTYDQGGLSSEWSTIELFTCGSKPEFAVWVYPTNGLSIAEAIPTFQWSSNIQTAYRVILYDENDFIIWDTEEVEGTTKAVTSGITLEDGVIYSVSILIRNAEGFWSDESKISFNTSYSQPPKPSMNIYGSDNAVVIEVINPESVGLQPQTVSNDIFKLIDNEWVQIAKGIPLDGVYVDYTARSKVEEQYRVRAIGENEGIQYSEIDSTTISFSGVYIHDTQDPEETIKHFKFDGGGRASVWAKEYVLMRFKGRRMPVAERSPHEERAISVTLQLLNADDLFALEGLARSYNTLCYRDGRGRLLFGFIPSLPVSDEKFGSQAQFEFIGIDYKGSV